MRASMRPDFFRKEGAEVPSRCPAALSRGGPPIRHRAFAACPDARAFRLWRRAQISHATSAVRRVQAGGATRVLKWPPRWQLRHIVSASQPRKCPYRQRAEMGKHGEAQFHHAATTGFGHRVCAGLARGGLVSMQLSGKPFTEPAFAPPVYETAMPGWARRPAMVDFD